MKKATTYHAGRTTLFCAIAELSVNDLYYNLAKEKQTTRHAVKQKYDLCMKEATRLKRTLSNLVSDVKKEAKTLKNEEYAEQVEDSIYEDVQFFYDIVRLIEDRCGTDNDLRTKLRAQIFNMKSQLNIY